MRASSQAAAVRFGSPSFPGGWEAQSQFCLVWIRVFLASQELLSWDALIICKATTKVGGIRVGDVGVLVWKGCGWGQWECG